MKKRTQGHHETSISGDTRADWSEAFALAPSLEVAYVWHASKFTREMLDGLLRIGFLHHQQIIWNKGRTVLTRTHYWFQHEPCWYVRNKNAPWHGKAGENSTIWDSASPKFIMGGSDEEKYDHPTQKPVDLMRRPILNHLRRGELVYDPFLGSGTTLAAAELTERVCYGVELDPKYADVIIERWQQLSGKQAKLGGSGCTFTDAKAERAGAAYGMWLPASSFHELLGGDTARSLEQVEHLGGLAAVPGAGGLLRALDAFLVGLAFLGGLALLRRNVGATWRNTGPFCWLSAAHCPLSLVRWRFLRSIQSF